jgi:hypothetical protein
MALIQMTQQDVDRVLRAGGKIPAGSVNVSGGAVVKSSDQPQNIKKLQSQILAQGLTGRWTGEGFGTPEQNAFEMAGILNGAGITDINQFGKLPDGSFGNKLTGKAISSNYSRAGGSIWSGTFTGKDSTGFGVQFGPDGTPYFYTQQGASTSDAGDIVPIVALGLAIFAPGIGAAIGSALTGTAATTLASQVVGGAIVSGLMSEASGGDFLDGAIKGAVTAGVAPAVANTVGQSVATAMADSAVKNVVANAVASSATSAVTAALTGGDVESAALTGALAGAGGSVGRELGIATDYGTTPFSEQTQMLAGQEVGLGGAGSIGANLGQAAGAIAGGVEADQALLSALSKIAAESAAATPTSGSSTTAESPVSPPSEAEKQPVLPPETDQISDIGPMDGVAKTIPEISAPSTQENTIPDQITQELAGVQEGESPLDVLGQPLTPEAVDIEPIPQDPLLGLSAPAVGEGEQEAIDYQALEDLSSAEVGLGEEEAIDQANLDALGELSSAKVGEGEQEAIDQQALEELSSAEVGEGEEQAIQDSEVEVSTIPFIRDTYLATGRRRSDFGPTVTTLGQALQAPFFSTSPVSSLTSYRGAGEIEGQRTGKPRRNVWNESSLRLKDALGL